MNRDLVRRANERLRGAGYRITIEVVQRSLCLRGTLPPRPGVDKPPHQQRIYLGIEANPVGLKLAEAKAIEVATKLTIGAFDWNDYVQTRERSKTIGELIDQFKADFFSRGQEQKRATSWQGDYWAVLKWLPRDVPLTIEVMERVIDRTVPNTRTRKRYCEVLERFGRFAGLECDFSHLKGSYGFHALNPKDIPTDEEILAVYDRIGNPQWRLVYGILAAFGIRPSEILNIDRSMLPKLVVLDGKTGEREVYPIPYEWIDRFELDRGELPSINCRHALEVNQRVYTALGRQGVPFPPQTLRHAYCIRGIVYGLPAEIGAAWAGHSVDLHNRVYQRWIQSSTHRVVFEKFIKKTGSGGY